MEQKQMAPEQTNYSSNCGLTTRLLAASDQAFLYSGSHFPCLSTGDLWDTSELMWVPCTVAETMMICALRFCWNTQATESRVRLAKDSKHDVETWSWKWWWLRVAHLWRDENCALLVYGTLYSFRPKHCWRLKYRDRSVDTWINKGTEHIHTRVFT